MAYRNEVESPYNTEITLITASPQTPGSTRAAVKDWLLKNKPETEEVQSSGAPDVVIGWMNNLIFYPNANGDPAAPLTLDHATTAGRDIRKQVLNLNPASTNTSGNQTNQFVLTTTLHNALTNPLPGTVPPAAALQINDALDFATTSLEHTSVVANFDAMICWFNRTLFAHGQYPTGAADFATQGSTIYSLLVAQEPAMA